MLRNRLLFLLAALPIFAVQPLVAATVQVGTCKPHLKSYPMISTAVSSVPPGSTVQVCPGTYAEQVTIAQQLTLVGVTAGTADQVLITVPSTGLLPNAVSIFGESVAAQVFVQGAGDVDISNIAVDGTGGDMACAGNLWIAGIFYGSSSSGTVDRVRTSGQVNGNCGVGIWAENGDNRTKFITIQNSSVYDIDSVGIFAGSTHTPSTLSVNVIDNVTNGNVVNAVTPTTAFADIQPDSVTGQILANDVSNAVFGVYDPASKINIAWNTIITTTFGVFLGSGDTAANNEVLGSTIGVLVGAAGATVSGNTLVSSTSAGVELGCLAAKVRDNFINDAPVGIDQSPSGSVGSNTFANTATTITGGCVTPAAASLAVQANSAVQVNSAAQVNSQQWHTPSTPFGTRTK